MSGRRYSDDPSAEELAELMLGKRAWDVHDESVPPPDDGSAAAYWMLATGSFALSEVMSATTQATDDGDIEVE